MIQARWIRLWHYNRWAWQHIFNSMGRLTQAEFELERPLFWGSLHGLLAHCLAAEKIWIARLEGENPDRLENQEDYPSLSFIQSEWETTFDQWKRYLDSVDDSMLAERINYKSTSGRNRNNERNDIVQHVFNHATEHRSQMTPILFNLNHPTPPLDFIYFSVEYDQKMKSDN